MAHLVLGGVKTDEHPAFVKIWCFGCRTGIYQHLRRVHAVCLGGKAVDPLTKTDEHLAADFPTVEFGRWV